MSTIVRKTASRRGEEYLEMSWESEGELAVTLVILFCEKWAESVRVLENGYGVQELVCWAY
jgi:hypothetical protein